MRDMLPGTRTKVHGAQYVSSEVEICGRVARPRTFTAEELRSLPRIEIPDYVMVCGSGKTKGGKHSIAGALLRDVLDQADVLLEEHESPNRTYLVATGTDGYFSLFSWHEAFNTEIGDGLLVVYEKDGLPLGEDEGLLCLISAKDQRNGPRRVRYLKKIEAREIKA